MASSSSFIHDDELCRLEKMGSFYVLTLLGDGEHRIHPSLVDSITQSLHSLTLNLSTSPHCSALITTNLGKFFCNGLDLSYPFPLLVGQKFQELLRSFLLLPMPTIAAVCGHASAAGFIWALSHDHILMRRDKGFLYMSEIDISFLIPPGVMNIVRCKMPPKAFKDAVLCGVKHTASMAYAAGFIDSVHEDSSSTMEAASALAQSLVSRSWKPDFYRDMREAMYPFVFQGLGCAGAPRSKI